MVHVLRQQPDIELAGVLTTVNEVHQRVAMHAVRVELLQTQADALGLPLWQVPIPSPCPNDVYERAMAAAVARAVGDGVTHMAFGDLFLEDIKRYREEKLAGTGLTPIFPLFGADTTKLAREMVAGGLKARLTSVDPKVLDRKFAGREFDQAPGAARRAAGVGRSLRRARRIPLVRVRGADVFKAHCDHVWRRRRTRRLRVRGCAPNHRITVSLNAPIPVPHRLPD